jgi:hypothetical protein
MDKAKILIVADHDFDLYRSLKMSLQTNHDDPVDARDDAAGRDVETG